MTAVPTFPSPLLRLSFGFAAGLIQPVDQILKFFDLALCKPLGKIGASTKSKIGLISRNEETVRTELQSLAKNQAVSMGADTILAESPPTEEGVQRFVAYRCD